MPVTVTDIVSEYGSYYVNEGQNIQRLLRTVKQSSFTASIAQKRFTENTQWRLSESTLNEVIQPFQKAFTQKGALDFDPKTIQLRRLKVDITVDPDDIVESWIGFLANDENENARAQWPLIRYLLEQHVRQQIDHDRETQVYWDGAYVAPTVDVAEPASESMDGVKKLLDDGISAGMNSVSLSALTTSNIFDQVEVFVDAFDDALEMEPMILCMSPYWKRWYFRDRRNTHGGNIHAKDDEPTVDYMDNIRIYGLPSMAGTNYIWATPASNFFHVMKTDSMKPFKLEERHRTVDILNDWWEALGFGINELVYVYQPPASASGS